MKEDTTSLDLLQTGEVNRHGADNLKSRAAGDATAQTLEAALDFFASIKLSIVLMLILAATSAIGTLIPQNRSTGSYLETFGPALHTIMVTLGLLNVYRSWLFQSLLSLLAANLVVCSLRRLPHTWEKAFSKDRVFGPDSPIRFSSTREFRDTRSIVQLEEVCHRVVASRFRVWKRSPTENGFCLYAEKGRWTRLGVYIAHLGVLFMLLGGMLGAIFGFDGCVNIIEGLAADRIQLANSKDIKILGFQIRCDDFNVSFYDDGRPKEFRSALTILEHGRPVLKQDVIVNGPLRYKGVGIFQSGYGKAAPEEIELSFSSGATGMIYEKTLKIGQTCDLPEKLGQFRLTGLVDAYRFKGQNLQECAVGVITPFHGEPFEIVLPFRYPKFDRMRKGNVMIGITGFVPRFYTALQVSRDPGVPLVYAGFIAVTLGCLIAFFMSHQRLFVDVRQDRLMCRVRIGGSAHKNKQAVAARVDTFVEQLASHETAA